MPINRILMEHSQAAALADCWLLCSTLAQPGWGQRQYGLQRLSCLRPASILHGSRLLRVQYPCAHSSRLSGFQGPQAHSSRLPRVQCPFALLLLSSHYQIEKSCFLEDWGLFSFWLRKCFFFYFILYTNSSSPSSPPSLPSYTTLLPLLRAQ